MKQLLLSRGEVSMGEVPAPSPRRGEIRVRVSHSALSVGTEKSTLSASGDSLLKKAASQPEKVWETTRQLGIHGLMGLVEQKLSEQHPLGYSIAGVVDALGADTQGFAIGERVACAGAEFAHHAEFVCVPTNLACSVPDVVKDEYACTATLGAIALQGLRRAEPTLGEIFVVIGLGLLGQLTIQLLRAQGCRVLGLELDEEKLELAKKYGLEDGAQDLDQLKTKLLLLSQHQGADAVIITASTSSSDVVNGAFSLCRRRGRVVLVGAVGLELKREQMYAKELDFRISTSYGPGRYDPLYEKEGQDYPYAHVRWTLNRNMQAYLQLLAEGRVRVKPLVEKMISFDQAPELYKKLLERKKSPLLILFQYEKETQAETKTEIFPFVQKNPSKPSLVLVGAGGFARTTLLPELSRLKDKFSFEGVVCRRGVEAANIARQWKAHSAATSIEDFLQDDKASTFIISTRHDTHAELVLECLKKGRHVFVEKPLCLKHEDLIRIKEALKDPVHPLLQIGYNRRHSPFAQRLKDFFSPRKGPMELLYRVNSPCPGKDHWTYGSQGGGRNLGEACHFYDLFHFLTDSKPVSIKATSSRENGAQPITRSFVVSISYSDGSIATLAYTAQGSKDLPKERLEVSSGGYSALLDDFSELHLYGEKTKVYQSRIKNKGHFEELNYFFSALAGGPAPDEQALFSAAETALEVEQQLLGGA